eukprot:SAG31_NODE_47281_length_251_cov_0.657895_1_plen_39_part_01
MRPDRGGALARGARRGAKLESLRCPEFKTGRPQKHRKSS